MNRLYQGVACLLLVALCSLQGALAQLPDGSIAPDFTATDINGVQHNLYDLLDDGKKVILEFTATWCGPCWNHHQTGVLSQLYEAYGPDGTDELRVFLLESDGSTNSLDLDGDGPNTMGDWVSNTPFPILDDAEWIFSLYNGNYYPTIFSICPDGTLSEAGWQSFEGHIANFAANDCALALPLDEVALLGMNHSEIFCPGAPQTITVQIQNQGLENLTSANLSLSVDEQELQSLSWNGNLPTFGITEVVFDQVYFAESTNFSIEINSPNDESFSNNTLTGYIEHSSDESGLLIHVEIMVDAWPEEIAWAITDDSGDVVEEIGSIGGGAGDVFDWWVTLPAEGCHIFEIFDSYGDGIYDGYCTVTSWWDEDNLASTIYDYDGSYWYQSDRASFSAASEVSPESVTFRVDMTSQEVISQNGVHVAGSFQGWQPGTHPLYDDDGDGIWEATFGLTPGEYEFKFINGNAWGGGGVGNVDNEYVLGECAASDSDNRVLTVGDEAQVYHVCYNECTIECPEEYVQSQCEPDFDFSGLEWGLSPDASLGEQFDTAYLGVPYSDVFHMLVPTTTSPFAFSFSLMLDSLLLSEVTLTDTLTLEQFSLEDIGLDILCNNLGSSPNPCSWLPDQQYCASLEGTPTIAGVFQMSLDVDVWATIFGPTSAPYSFDGYIFEVLQEYPGCLDENACNYDPGATIPNPSACTYPGCQDSEAVNFDPAAGCSGECVYLTYDCNSIGADAWADELVGVYPAWQEAMHGIDWATDWVLHVPATITDSASGITYPIHHFEWSALNGMPVWVSDVNFELGDMGPNEQQCISASGIPELPGIYTLSVSGELFISIFGQPFSAGDFTFDFELDVLANPNPILGCTYPLASNHDWYATADDGSCLFPGCTDPEASNFSPIANIDDGSCGDGCNPDTTTGCSSDNDGDGIITVSDLLILLGEFGLTCE